MQNLSQTRKTLLVGCFVAFLLTMGGLFFYLVSLPQSPSKFSRWEYWSNPTARWLQQLGTPPQANELSSWSDKSDFDSPSGSRAQVKFSLQGKEPISAINAYFEKAASNLGWSLEIPKESDSEYSYYYNKFKSGHRRRFDIQESQSGGFVDVSLECTASVCQVTLGASSSDSGWWMF